MSIAAAYVRYSVKPHNISSHIHIVALRQSREIGSSHQQSEEDLVISGQTEQGERHLLVVWSVVTLGEGGWECTKI